MENINKMLVQAAGGLVSNEKGGVLLMFRRGKWDLPKGKLDPGETLEACALREVREETGLIHLELKRFLMITRHEYKERGSLILKESHWWLMQSNSNQKLVPQVEEDITVVRWFDPSELKIALANTYPTISDVMRMAGLLKD
jgi:8-oxo-dGTP pyrophosphatase MutT (NUDIX family)